MSYNFKSILSKKTFLLGIVAIIFLPFTLLAMGWYLIISGINMRKKNRIIFGVIIVSFLMILFIQIHRPFNTLISFTFS